MLWSQWLEAFKRFAMGEGWELRTGCTLCFAWPSPSLCNPGAGFWLPSSEFFRNVDPYQWSRIFQTNALILLIPLVALAAIKVGRCIPVGSGLS